MENKQTMTETQTILKASDLRIGNWVLLNDIHFGKVISIEQNQFTTENPYNKRMDGRTGDYWIYETDYVKPIELTPEILEIAGFENSTFFEGVSTGVYTNNGLRIGRDGEDYVKNQYTAIFRNGVFIKIKYLHQLQNLYHSLTGTELEINL